MSILRRIKTLRYDPSKIDDLLKGYVKVMSAIESSETEDQLDTARCYANNWVEFNVYDKEIDGAGIISYVRSFIKGRYLENKHLYDIANACSMEIGNAIASKEVVSGCNVGYGRSDWADRTKRYIDNKSKIVDSGSIKSSPIGY